MNREQAITALRFYQDWHDWGIRVERLPAHVRQAIDTLLIASNVDDWDDRPLAEVLALPCIMEALGEVIPV